MPTVAVERLFKIAQCPKYFKSHGATFRQMKLAFRCESFGESAPLVGGERHEILFFWFSLFQLIDVLTSCLELDHLHGFTPIIAGGPREQ